MINTLVVVVFVVIAVDELSLVNCPNNSKKSAQKIVYHAGLGAFAGYLFQ